MRSKLTAAISLFTFTVRQTLADRRLVLAFLLLVSPAAFGLLIRFVDHGKHGPQLWDIHQGLLLFMLLSGALPMTAMLYGPALITTESESGTLVYLFTRRLKRYHVLLVRYAAQTLVLSLLGMLSAVAVHAALLIRQAPAAITTSWPTMTPTAELQLYLAVIPWAAAAYLAIFSVISLLTNKALLVSGMYLVIVEMVIGNLPAGVRAYTLSHQLRRSLAGAMPRIRSMFGPNDELFAQIYPAGDTGTVTLAIIIAILLFFSAALTTSKELSARQPVHE